MYKSDVVAYFKRPVAVARFLRLARGTVAQWREVIPESAATKLHIKTQGALQYREELYYPDLAAKASEERPHADGCHG